MLKILLSYLHNCYLYQPNMTEFEVYKYMLKDIKSKNPHKISEQFYKDLNGIRKDIIDLDSQNYYAKGNNNLSKLLVKYFNESENTLRYIKKDLKHKLYILYITTIQV